MVASWHRVPGDASIASLVIVGGGELYHELTIS